MIAWAYDPSTALGPMEVLVKPLEGVGSIGLDQEFCFHGLIFVVYRNLDMLSYG